MEHEQPSRENFISEVDTFFKSEETELASWVLTRNSQKGKDYLNSMYKRILDLMVGVPASMIAILPIIFLALAKMLEDGKFPFFVQKREGGLENDGKKVSIVKIRTMKPNSDLGENNSEVVDNGSDDEDDRITKLGLVLRKMHLDELPQLIQIVLGQLSVIGPRSVPKRELSYLKEEWRDKNLEEGDEKFVERYKKFEEWEKMYGNIPQGLSGIWQVYNKGEKKIRGRFHYEMFYNRNASLGLDLYLIWRTVLKMIGS